MAGFIHHTVEISENASVGDNTKIWQHCIIQDAKIGRDCLIGANVYIENGVEIGNRVKIKNNISLYSGVKCEDDVFLGPNCVFTNVINPRSFIERKHEFKETVVKRGSTIGANATIVCGHTLGEYSMVGAGSVVTRDVEPYSLVVGNPARKIGYVCECGERICFYNSIAKCNRCEKNYSLVGERVSVILPE